MATVVVSRAGASDLARLIATHSLPADTIARFSRSVRALEHLPLLGAPLHGRWARYRFVLGPWRWMLVVYLYDEATDRVAIVIVQDGRSSEAGSGPAGRTWTRDELHDR